MASFAGKRIGRYDIRSLLGKGGMGEVYLAEDTELKRPVALKFLSEELTQTPEHLSRFIQEARAASALNHPNIITIYDFGRAEGNHFISTEYVEGHDLRVRLSKSSMTPGEVLEVAVQIASALDAAHSAGITHRDIKPDNIILRSDGYIKILDFGLAKFMQAGEGIELGSGSVVNVKTVPGVIMGTPQYMSPEQARGKHVDHRTDIFSFGIVMYEMLTRRTPFSGETPNDIVAAILLKPPPPINEFVSDIPVDLQNVVRKSLRKLPAERYQSFGEMLGDLKKVQGRIRNRKESIESAETELLESSSWSSEEAEKRCIAVLPFKNMSRNEADDFYEFALADMVITELAQINSLRVRPSSVVSKYQGKDVDANEVGHELGAHTVLSAGYFTAGDRIRVTAQLINVITGEIQWSDRIDVEGDDILAIQDSIGQQILDGLKLELSDEEQQVIGQRPTENAEAYEEYLRGRDNLGRFMFRTVSTEDFDAAVKNFERAIQLDPKFALAHSGLGACFANRFFRGLGKPDDYTIAEESFTRALSYDPEISESRVLMAMISMSRQEKDKARIEIEKLEKKFPNEAPIYFIKGIISRLDGKYDESHACFDKLSRLDPSSRAVSCYNRARLYIYQGEHRKAIKLLDRGEKAEPDNPMVKIFRSNACFHHGEVDKAIELIRGVLDKIPQMDGIRSMYAIYLAHRGRREDAYEQLSDEVMRLSAADNDMAYWVCSAYSLLGEKEKALDWFEKSIKLGYENKPWFERDKTLDPIRDESRFKELIDGIGNYQSRSTDDL